MKKKIGSVSDIPLNQGKLFQEGDNPIAVFNVDGRLCAINNTCPHRGGSLVDGDLEGKVVTCPWHHWEFDVTTGLSTVNPAVFVKKYDCQVEGDTVLVEIPEG